MLVGLHIIGDLLIYAYDPMRSWSLLVDSQMGLLTWWALAASTRPSLRVSGWAIGTAFLFAVLSGPYSSSPAPPIPWDEFTWIAYFGTCPGMFAREAPMTVLLMMVTRRVLRFVPFHGIRAFGAPAEHSPEPRPQSLQFDVRDLLILVTGLSLAMGLLATVQPYWGWILELATVWFRVAEMPRLFIFHAAAASAITLTTLGAAWAVLGRRALVLRLVVMVLLVPILGVPLGLLFTLESEGPLLVDLIGGCATVAILSVPLVGSFLVIRFSSPNSFPDAQSRARVPRTLPDSPASRGDEGQ